MERKGGIVYVVIRKRTTVKAILSLIRNLRAIKGLISLTLPSNPQSAIIEPSSANLVCLALGRFALLRVETKRKKYIQSHFYTSSDAIRYDSSLPEIFHTLTSMYTPDASTANTLIKLQSTNLNTTCFYYPDQNDNYLFGKLPDTYIWPDKKLNQGHVLNADNLGSHAEIINIAIETAIAYRAPILQKGLMRSDSDDDDEYFPFARLIYPLSAQSEHPSNYRALTIGVRLLDNSVLV